MHQAESDPRLGSKILVTDLRSISAPKGKMPGSINSFLQTHPNKRKDYLEHICEYLKLSPNGTVDTLRSRIVDHIERNADMDEKVRELASQYKSSEAKKGKNQNGTPNPQYPLTPLVLIANSATAHSTPTASAGISISQPFTQDLFDETQQLPHDRVKKLSGVKNLLAFDDEGIAGEEVEDEQEKNQELCVDLENEICPGSI